MADASPEEVVLEFFKSMETSDFATGRAAFEARLTDDAIWANSGFPDAVGKEGCLAMWDGFHEATGFVGLRLELKAIGTKGNDVVTERIDHLMNATGEVFFSLPVAGTLVVRDGKICAWRDYWDPRPFLTPGG